MEEAYLQFRKFQIQVATFSALDFYAFLLTEAIFNKEERVMLRDYLEKGNIIFCHL